jgi:hypothetical protein
MWRKLYSAYIYYWLSKEMSPLCKNTTDNLNTEHVLNWWYGKVANTYSGDPIDKENIWNGFGSEKGDDEITELMMKIS